MQYLCGLAGFSLRVKSQPPDRYLSRVWRGHLTAPDSASILVQMLRSARIFTQNAPIRPHFAPERNRVPCGLQINDRRIQGHIRKAPNSRARRDDYGCDQPLFRSGRDFDTTSPDKPRAKSACGKTLFPSQPFYKVCDGVQLFIVKML